MHPSAKAALLSLRCNPNVSRLSRHALVTAYEATLAREATAPGAAMLAWENDAYANGIGPSLHSYS